MRKSLVSCCLQRFAPASCPPCVPDFLRVTDCLTALHVVLSRSVFYVLPLLSNGDFQSSIACNSVVPSGPNAALHSVSSRESLAQLSLRDCFNVTSLHSFMCLSLVRVTVTRLRGSRLKEEECCVETPCLVLSASHRTLPCHPCHPCPPDSYA